MIYYALAFPDVKGIYDQMLTMETSSGSIIPESEIQGVMPLIYEAGEGQKAMDYQTELDQLLMDKWFMARQSN